MTAPVVIGTDFVVGNGTASPLTRTITPPAGANRLMVVVGMGTFSGNGPLLCQYTPAGGATAYNLRLVAQNYALVNGLGTSGGSFTSIGYSWMYLDDADTGGVLSLNTAQASMGVYFITGADRTDPFWGQDVVRGTSATQGWASSFLPVTTDHLLLAAASWSTDEASSGVLTYASACTTAGWTQIGQGEDQSVSLRGDCGCAAYVTPTSAGHYPVSFSLTQSGAPASRIGLALALVVQPPQSHSGANQWVAWGFETSGGPTNGTPAGLSDMDIAPDVTPFGSGLPSPLVLSPPTKDFTKIIGGSAVSIALRSDGSVWVCGSDLQRANLSTFASSGSGSLAQGADYPPMRTPFWLPAQVASIQTGVTDIAGSGFTYYALKADGSIQSWGLNGFGQLGRGNTTNFYEQPGLVTGLAAKTVTKVCSGTNNAFAICSDGSVYAWGNNGQGKLGIGSTTNVSTPTLVGGVPLAQDIACGNQHTVLLGRDGTVWVAGDNTFGQIGNGAAGTPASSTTFVQVGGISGATAISANVNTCYARAGTLLAWGRNEQGQCAQGNLTSPVVTPTAMLVSPGATIIFPRSLYAQSVALVARSSTNVVYFCGQSTGSGAFDTNRDPVTLGSLTTLAPIPTSGGYAYPAYQPWYTARLDLAHGSAAIEQGYNATFSLVAPVIARRPPFGQVLG